MVENVVFFSIDQLFLLPYFRMFLSVVVTNTDDSR